MSTLSAPAAPALFWDQARINLAMPDQDAYELYQMKKMLGLAMHKIQARERASKALSDAMELKALQEDASEMKRCMDIFQLMGYELAPADRILNHDLNCDADLMAAMAQADLDQGAALYPYKDEAADQNYIGTRGKKASIPLLLNQGSDAALLKLYRSLPAQHIGQKGFEAAISHLMLLIELNLEIQKENKQLKDKAERAKAFIQKANRSIWMMASNQQLSDEEKAARLELIAQRNEADADLKKAQEILNKQRQRIIKWEGIIPAMEICKAAARGSELLGAGIGDALAAAHGLPNRLGSKARKLLDQFSINQSGQGAEHIASSFAGFPEAADLIQEGFLKLEQNAQRRNKPEEAQNISILNQQISYSWKMMRRAASTKKRNMAAAMRGDAERIARPEIEAIDPLDALDNQGIWDLAQKCCTEKELAALKLIYRDEYSQREAAAILGIAKSPLLKRLRAGEKKIRLALMAE